MGEWMGGWMGGRESRVKDCLQQSKNIEINKIAIYMFKLSLAKERN
jgi:hypothetical protein